MEKIHVMHIAECAGGVRERRMVISCMMNCMIGRGRRWKR